MTDLLDFVQYKGPAGDHKNLLFLGDGFSKQDSALFVEAVKKITEHLFTSIQPFNLPGVREKFNVFYFFSESPSPGISCINPKLEKDSALGLEYKGGRTIKPREDKESAIRDQIELLSFPGEPLIPGCWQVPEDGTIDPLPVGKDRGLVCVLVNDDVIGGTAFPPASKEGEVNYFDWMYCCAVSLGHRKIFNFIIDSDGHVVDHIPVSVADSVRDHIQWITSVVAHELGHSHFGLGDEYSEQCLLMDWMLGQFPEQHPRWVKFCSLVQSRPNVTTKNELQDDDWASVKWNLPRDGSSDPSSPRIIKPEVLEYLENMNPDFRTLWKSPAPYQRNFEDSSPSLPPKDLKLDVLDRTQIIGVYEQGNREYLGVYRPAGICRMRNTLIRDVGNSFCEGSVGKEAQFCYVCKYAIINKIDPSLLPLMAKQQYPK